MGTLADRIAFLTRRYGSDPAAWQGELHALASLEESAPKEALERFHLLKRRLAEFRRAELLRALRAFPFAQDVPSGDVKGFPLKEIEADIRAASRALSHARAIEAALAERARLAAALQRRAAPAPPALAAARWDALAPVAEAAEEARRAVAAEARVDRRLADAHRRARRLARVPVAVPELARAPLAEADAALDALERALDAAERVDEAYARVLDHLKAPDVATYLHESRKALEREAKALLARADAAGLAALEPRARALAEEGARRASQAARARRAGAAPPPRERRPGDTLDGYG